MRILLVVVYYLPSKMSSAKLIHDISEEFCKKGHECCVLAPDDSLPSKIQVSLEKDIIVCRVKTGKIKSASKVFRALNEIRLSSVLWSSAKEFLCSRSFDLIIYYSPTIFFGSLIKKLKAEHNCPAYLILRDIFPGWAVDAGMLKRGLVYRYFKRKEYENYSAADIIGVQSPANLEYFSKNGFNQTKQMEVLFNWARIEEKEIPYGNYRDKFRLQDKVVFFFGGNIGIAQDMSNIIRLAENMRGFPDAFFLLVGDGNEVTNAKIEIAKKGLKNIEVHPSVGQEEYLGMLSEFDVGLISLNRDLKTQNFPGKMLGYMFHSMPILASINPQNDLKDVLEKNKAGLVSINGDDASFFSNALSLLKNAQLRSQMGNNARKLLVEKFSVEQAAKQILSHFVRQDMTSARI